MQLCPRTPGIFEYHPIAILLPQSSPLPPSPFSSPAKREPRGVDILPTYSLHSPVFGDFLLNRVSIFFSLFLKQGNIFVANVLTRVWFWVKCVKQGQKSDDFCLKQGKGVKGRVPPAQPRIYRVLPGREPSYRFLVGR